MTTKNSGPVLIEMSDAPLDPGAAPQIPEGPEPPFQSQSMQTLAVLTAKRPSKLWRLFWATLISLFVFALSVNAWDFVFSLLERNIWMGRIAVIVTSLFVISAIVLALREWLAFARLRRIDGLRAQANKARSTKRQGLSRPITDKLLRLYSGRADLQWAISNFHDLQGDALEDADLLDLAELELITPLDNAARKEIEAAARQVATITAIVPLALVDVITVLAANLRMVRRIAEIYGGRSGLFGSWRLLRTVMLHLAATGAVSIGDDLIGALAGGGLVSKISRRFGEGVINGALTARVGVAAMEVCRPLPFHRLKKPGVTGLVKNALAGLFGSKSN